VANGIANGTPLRKLKDACGNCAKPLDPEWKICPYCEAEIPGKTPMPRRRRTHLQSKIACRAPTTILV